MSQTQKQQQHDIALADLPVSELANRLGAEAARAAERGGQSAVALRAMLDAVRLGDARAADGLARLDVDCAVGRLAQAYARALSTGDASALDGAAAAFAELGMNGVAKDAMAQADRARN